MGDGSESSEFVNMTRIASLHLPLELVYLSACNTADGGHLNGTGLQSTAFAFGAAGARSLIASHWALVDGAAHRLAELFYRAKATMKSNRIALLQAQRDLYMGLNRHPYYWGGMTYTLNSQ